MNPHARLPAANELAAAAIPAATARNNQSKRSPSREVNGPVLPPHPRPGLSGVPDHVFRFFASLRLTVVALGLGMILVFAGTLAQVDLGLYKAQNEFFRSFFISWGPKGAGWTIPVFPGGYLVGGVLLLNLVAAHFKRFHLSRDKVGIWLIHFGLILLLLGQLMTDMLSRETVLHLREGEAKNYTESTRQCELAVADTTDPNVDTVVAIPEDLLASQKQIRRAEFPFVIHVQQYFPNSVVGERTADPSERPAASQGLGPRAVVRGAPRVTDMDHRDVPSAVLEVVTPKGESLGSWLVSEFIDQPQSFTWNNHTYNLSLRLRRYYKPYTIRLLKFSHDIYRGTDIPKNFASRVRVQNSDNGESREVDIHMNSPLRYAGETYYQADWDKDDHGTILQVVHNPSWLTPYLSCILVGLGLVVQFATHLLGFTFKRRTA